MVIDTRNVPKQYMVLVNTENGRFQDVAKLFVDGGDHANTIDSTHAYIHKGHTYAFGHYATGVSDNADIELLVVTGASYDFHLAVDVAGGGDFWYEIFEETTTTNNGTPVTVFNKVRGITGDTKPVTVYHTPSIDSAGSDGTRLGPVRYIPGGRAASSNGAIGTARGEWVLKPSTKYLLRVTNKAGTSKTLALYCEGYEHDSITAKDSV